jgi:leucyl aminopeptidase
MSFITESSHSIPIVPLVKNELADYLKEQADFVSNWVNQSSFEASPNEFCLVPNQEEAIDRILCGVEIFSAGNPDSASIWSISSLSTSLPEGEYHLESNWSENQQIQAAIGWGLGAYRFDFFKKEFLEPKKMPLLKVANDQLAQIQAFVDAFTLVRDMVNTPANHMMPEELSEVVQELALQHQAQFSEIVGDDLLTENFPAIHAVGRASEHPPRLIKLEWSSEVEPSSKELPLLTLVGKGVCFDTGGLDLKPSKFMRNMKKDMGGAAHVLGLAHLIMSFDLPLRLQVLIAAADNAISGDAFRPGDIIDTRAHKTVEIDNTDAEGRLVLCDALTLACETSSSLIIDFATLTGAARVAVGTEIPALFSNSATLSKELQQASDNTGETLWPLPLHHAYRYQLDSPVADITNCSAEGYGGAITAALYLNEFVDEGIEWAHLDVMAWNNRARVGRPKGGEAMGLLSVFNYLQQRFI